jgi:hypothetical protein
LLEKRPHSRPVPGGNGIDPRSNIRRRLLGGGDQPKERISGLGHGGNHDGLTRHWLIEQDVGNPAETVSVRQAGAAKFVDVPTAQAG